MEDLDGIFEQMEDLQQQDMTEEADGGDAERDERQDEGAEASNAKVPAEDEAETETMTETVTYTLNHRSAELDKKAVASIASAIGTAEDEVVALLQKGADYDRRTEQYGRLTNEYGEVIERVDEYARERGIKPSEAQAELLRLADTAETFELMREIRSQNPEMDADAVSALAKERHISKRLSARLEGRRGKETDEQRIENRWMEFFSRHPELARESLPDEVYRFFIDGYSPEESWLMHKRGVQAKKQKELEDKMAKLQQAERIKKTSPGSLEASRADTKPNDFDEGWDSAF